MSYVEFRLVILEDGKEVLAEPLSAELMPNLLNYYPDNNRSKLFFKYASMHASADVRQQVASKDKIDEDTCEILSRDNSIAVLRNLLRNSVFREFVTLEILTAYLENDKELAELVAGDVECFKSVDTLALSEVLARHPDPSVVLALARNRRVPKKILRDLTQSNDLCISIAAQESLK